MTRAITPKLANYVSKLMRNVKSLVLLTSKQIGSVGQGTSAVSKCINVCNYFYSWSILNVIYQAEIKNTHTTFFKVAEQCICQSYKFVIQVLFGTSCIYFQTFFAVLKNCHYSNTPYFCYLFIIIGVNLKTTNSGFRLFVFLQRIVLP